MKIITGVSSLETARERIAAGADEIFCGYLSPGWIDHYGFFSSTGRRWGRESNFTRIDHLQAVIEEAHQKDIHVSITFNAQNYTPGQMEIFEELFHEVVLLKPDAVIVSDITLLIHIARNYPELKTHISTGGTVFNSEAVDFYRELGASRIIFPRALSFNECIVICNEFPGLEFEVFSNNSRCLNIDGYCFFEHTIVYPANEKKRNINYSMCNVDYSIDLDESGGIGPEEKEMVCSGWLRRRNFFNEFKSCRACDLYELSRNNVSHYKIPARDHFSKERREAVLKEIRFLKEMINHLPEFHEKENYKAFAKKKFYEYFKLDCSKESRYCL